MEKNRIGLQIKEFRKAKGLTQSDLGELLGMSKQQIAYYENGHRIPTVENTLQKICEALGVDFDVVLKPK